jgi:peptidyl-prolyl cis-trans isomerase SurA
MVFLVGLRGAVVLDRIAVIAGKHVIKISDIDRDIRLTDFLNRAPLSFSPSVKRQAAERLITQQIIRDEIVSGGYRRPPEAEAVDLETQIRRDRFGGSEPGLVEGLQRYGLTRAELRTQLLWQLTVLKFIDERFRAGVVVEDDDARTAGEKINQAFDEWLDQARKSEKVEFKEGAFE